MAGVRKMPMPMMRLTTIIVVSNVVSFALMAMAVSLVVLRTILSGAGGFSSGIYSHTTAPWMWSRGTVTVRRPSFHDQSSRPPSGTQVTDFGLDRGLDRQPDILDRGDEVREAVAVGEGHAGRVEQMDAELSVAGRP